MDSVSLLLNPSRNGSGYRRCDLCWNMGTTRDDTGDGSDDVSWLEDIFLFLEAADLEAGVALFFEKAPPIVFTSFVSCMMCSLVLEDTLCNLALENVVLF